MYKITWKSVLYKQIVIAKNLIFLQENTKDFVGGSLGLQRGSLEGFSKGFCWGVRWRVRGIAGGVR